MTGKVDHKNIKQTKIETETTSFDHALKEALDELFARQLRRWYCIIPEVQYQVPSPGKDRL